MVTAYLISEYNIISLSKADKLLNEGGRRVMTTNWHVPILHISKSWFANNN